MSPEDEAVYEWAKTQNRGIPHWDSMSGSTQAFWRDLYRVRHEPEASHSDR